jgi:hypothetical protein
MLAELNEQDLAEIRALAEELDKEVQRSLKQLKRIREARARLAADPNGVAPLVAFVHVPKTAGATVTSMLAAAYSKAGLHKAGNYMRGRERTAQKVSKSPGGWEDWHRRGGRVSVGHVPYGLFRKHLPEETWYMTFLREPVDRVLSHYYRHIHVHDARRAGQVTERSGKRAKADSIEQALVEMRLPHLNNLCTRFLCGHESPLGPLPASALDDAKENLRGFAFVGIQERFEESIVLLQRMLGLGSLPYVDRHVSLEGRRPAVDEIPDEQRALIAECNQLDAELYRFGLGLFEEAVAAADEGFAADVEALRARDAAAREDEWRATALAPNRRSSRRRESRPEDTDTT